MHTMLLFMGLLLSFGAHGNSAFTKDEIKKIKAYYEINQVEQATAIHFSQLRGQASSMYRRLERAPNCIQFQNCPSSYQAEIGGLQTVAIYYEDSTKVALYVYSLNGDYVASGMELESSGFEWD